MGWHFAWLAAEGEAFDPVAHRRRDLPIKTVNVREEEGVDAHAVTIETMLMPVAALAGKGWALLSYGLRDGTLVPICRMKRRPMPAGDAEAELSVEFYARPSDWMNRRDVGLQPLKVRPFYEPLFIAPGRRSDPVEILDGHRRIGHFDRVTGAYTTPELLGLGLPVKVLRKADIIGHRSGGGLKVRRVKEPLAGVQVNIGMAWQQADDGYIDLTPELREAFPDGAVGDWTGTAPSATKRVPAGVISTLTPDNLVSAMPKAGSGLGGASGYTVLEATLKRIPVPPGAAERTGACRGQKMRYDYVKDGDLKEPINLGFEIAFFDGTLVLQYSLRQRREQNVRFFITNRNVSYADGAVETLNLRCEDPTLDTNTQPWQPGQNVAIGDQRRVGIRVWSCLRAHVTAPTFTQDLEAADGTDLWELLGETGAPARTSNLADWFGTPAGQAMVAAAAHKALKKLALEQRCVEVKVVVPLEDWPDVSTAWACRIEVDHPLITGGVAFGKVTSVSISQATANDCARASVTLMCCNGGGIAGPGPDAGINPSGEPWDGIFLGSTIGIPVQPTPLPGAIIVAVNHPQAQVQYVQERDYTGEPGRNDRTLNDPKHLLGEVKTDLVISATPISGQPTLQDDIALGAGAWSGPAQIITPEV